MPREVEVKITKDGAKVEFDAKGFEGTSCSDFMGTIFKALGTVEEEKKKPEYYARPHQKTAS